MKRISLIIVSILLLSSMVYLASAEDLTSSDIKNMLRDLDELNNIKDKANPALESLPGSLKKLVGTDRTYHGRIGSSNIAVVLKGGKIESITPGKPSKAEYRVDVRTSTAVSIANAKDPVTDAVKALIMGRIVITELPECEEDIACADNQVCYQGKCEDAYTVAVVPLGYSGSDWNEFYEKAKPEIDLMENHLPMDEDKLRVHYINPSVCPNYQCTDVCRDCQSKAAQCVRAAGLSGVTDKVAAISKGDVKTNIGNGQWLMLCGCAGGIPSYTSVSRSRLYAPEGVYCYDTVTHELGHQLGLYHVNSDGTEAGACRGPNAADCNDQKKSTDLMGYAVPSDHFGPAAVSYLKNNEFRSFQ